MKKIGLLIYILSFSFLLKGQENSIYLLSQPDEKGVLLRWAPSSKTVSDWITKHGVNIERTTLKINGKLNPSPKKITLNSSPILPTSENDPSWDDNSDDNYTLVAWQFLYQELPEEDKKGNATSKLLYQKQNQDMLFGFYLISADFSRTAAKLAGLYWEDNTAKKGNEYVYRIVPAKLNNLLTIEPGITVCSSDKPIDFPLLKKPTYERTEKKVEINWNIEYLNYSGYSVEKSTDNKNFTPLNSDPIVSVSEIDQNIVSYTDTAVKYGETYYYRIKGINSFATKSSPSESLEIEIYEQLVNAPKITEAIPLEEKVEIEWSWEKENKDKANQLYLTRCEKIDGQYSAVSKNLYNKTEFEDNNPLPGNYYQFVAKNKQGDSVVSTPIFVQLIDNKPPSPPEELKGVIDSNGIVTLTWKPNTENDINGYRVFRANYANHEYSQVTIGACKDSVFFDTISLNNLTNTIFYKILAVDYHYNPSKFSEPVELVKPDTIAPISPIFKSYQTNEKGVKLVWINSSSKDIDSHILYKKDNGNWEEVKKFSNQESSYYDSIKTDELVTYKIVAQDKAGLFSKNPKLLQVKKVNRGYSEIVPILEITINEETNTGILTWNSTQKGIKSVMLYKSKDGQGMRLIKTMSYSEKEHIEHNIKIGALYEYRIKYVLNNGKESKFSELKSIKR